jgi:hypothetical protein
MRALLLYFFNLVRNLPSSILNRVTHEEQTWFDPIPERMMIDRRRSHLEVVHCGGHLYLQDGHLCDPATHKAAKL